MGTQELIIMFTIVNYRLLAHATFLKKLKEYVSAENRKYSIAGVLLGKNITTLFNPLPVSLTTAWKVTNNVEKCTCLP